MKQTDYAYQPYTLRYKGQGIGRTRKSWSTKLHLIQSRDTTSDPIVKQKIKIYQKDYQNKPILDKNTPQMLASIHFIHIFVH